jgi:hypothetical protein
MSEETREMLLNGSIQDVDLLMWEIKETIRQRQDVDEVIIMMEENGIHLQSIDGTLKICGKKRPSPE